MTFRALLLVGALALPLSSQAAVVPVPSAPASFADLVAHVLPSVVTITAEQEDGVATGSGFIIDQQGDIVTNNHVVADAESLTVRFDDGQQVKAVLVGRDPDTDLAVIRAPVPRGTPIAVFGSSDQARVGDWTVAIGSPFGLQNSVAVGVISALHRGLSERYGDFIQTDDPINHGNSGGPLFNMSGQVIGVNSAIISPTQGSAGLSFSIPSKLVRRVTAQLIAAGHATHGWIGARFAKGNGEDAVVEGVKVGSPAALAGLRSGDKVVSVNGDSVEDAHSLAMKVFWSDAGAHLGVDVMRDDKPVHLDIVVAVSPQENAV